MIGNDVEVADQNAQAQQGSKFDPKTPVNLTVTLQEVNVILAALQEMPHKVADPVLRSIIPQAEAQLKAAQQQ